MFSRFEQKTNITRVYRNIITLENLQKVNNDNSLNITEIGLKRIQTRLQSQTFVFGNNKSSDLVRILIMNFLQAVYSDIPYINRDLSFVYLRRYMKNMKWVTSKTINLDIKKSLQTRISDQKVYDLVYKMSKVDQYQDDVLWISGLYDDVQFIEFKKSFDSGEQRAYNPEYRRLSSQLKRARDKARTTGDYTKVKELEQQLRQEPIGLQKDENFKRVVQVRYGTEVLTGWISSKPTENAYHNSEFIPWLNTVMSIKSSDVIKKYQSKTGVRRGRYTHSSVRFYIEQSTMEDLIRQYKIGVIKSNDYNPIAKSGLIHLTPEGIINWYNKLLENVYNEFSRCSNVSILQSFGYVAEYSMYKTLAAKYKTSISKLKTKYYRHKKFKIGDNVFQKPKFSVKKSL